MGRADDAADRGRELDDGPEVDLACIDGNIPVMDGLTFVTNGEWVGRAELTTEIGTAHDLARALLGMGSDEPVEAADLVVRTLRQVGYDWEVREASDGAEGLAAVQADEPDVVLSDWNVPQ